MADDVISSDDKTFEREEILDVKIENAGSLESEIIDTEQSLSKTKFLENFTYASNVFGEPNEKLIEEFGIYKATKLFSRANLMLTDAKIGQAELKSNILSAVQTGIGSVTVFPCALKDAMKIANGKIGVRVALFYPFAAENFKTKRKAVKKAAKLKVAAIELPLYLGDLANTRRQKIEKEWLLYKKAAKAVEVIMVADFDLLKAEEIKTIFSVCKTVGVKIKNSTCVLSSGLVNPSALDDSALIKEVRKEYSSKKLDAKDFINFFSSGAETVSSPDILNACKKLKEKLSFSDAINRQNPQ